MAGDLAHLGPGGQARRVQEGGLRQLTHSEGFPRPQDLLGEQAKEGGPGRGDLQERPGAADQNLRRRPRQLRRPATPSQVKTPHAKSYRQSYVTANSRSSILEQILQ